MKAVTDLTYGFFLFVILINTYLLSKCVYIFSAPSELVAAAAAAAATTAAAAIAEAVIVDLGFTTLLTSQVIGVTPTVSVKSLTNFSQRL